MPTSERDVRAKDESDEFQQPESHCGVEEQSPVLRNNVQVEVRTFDCEVQHEAEDKRRQHRPREHDRAEREVPCPPSDSDRCPWRDRDDKHDEQNLQQGVLHFRDGMSVLVDSANDEVQAGGAARRAASLRSAGSTKKYCPDIGMARAAPTRETASAASRRLLLLPCPKRSDQFVVAKHAGSFLVVRAEEPSVDVYQSLVEIFVHRLP